MTKQPKPPTSTSRVAALRERRAREGLVRLDVYARPEHHAIIREFVAKLEKRRLLKNLPEWGDVCK